MIPHFPYFKPIQVEDAPLFNDIISEYVPETSEWTFTNLFAWKDYYRFEWSSYHDWIIVIGSRNDIRFAMQPIGPSPRHEVVQMIFEQLKKENGLPDPFIDRADSRLVSELKDAKQFTKLPQREHFDYLYLRTDLANLEGNRYRSKRNRINQMMRYYHIESYCLTREYIDDCLLLQEKWCLMRRCEEDMSLLGEWQAIREMLVNFENLTLTGCVITVDGKIEAFTVGEMLNDDTIVVHIEKANPEIPGLYAVINQQANSYYWNDATFVNREQDLGLAGLREAKLSYDPVRLIEKYRIIQDDGLSSENE